MQTAKRILCVLALVGLLSTNASAIGRRCANGQCGNSNSQTSVQVKQAQTEALQFAPATTVSVNRPVTDSQLAMIESRATQARELEELNARLGVLAKQVEAQQASAAATNASLQRIADLMAMQQANGVKKPAPTLDDEDFVVPEKLAKNIASRIGVEFVPR